MSDLSHNTSVPIVQATLTFCLILDVSKISQSSFPRVTKKKKFSSALKTYPMIGAIIADFSDTIHERKQGIVS